MGGATIGLVVGHIERRRFLLALAGVAVGAASGCRRTVATAPLPPRQAPLATSNELGRPKHMEEAEAYLVAVPENLRDRALALLDTDLHAGVKAGLLALWARCPKDRLLLRYCESSRWFVCPNCSSMFNGLGDKTVGPAPHGMDMFRIEVDADRNADIVRRDRVQGLPVGTQLVEQHPEGLLCS